MEPKALRKNILEYLYQHRSEDFINPEALLKALSVPEEKLHVEVCYLDDKGLLKIVGGKYIGQKYLNFSALKITSYGIDLVEDAEEFGRVFSVHINNTFEKVKNSNIAINPNNAGQKIGIIDEGSNNHYENVEVEGSDVGMVNRGNKTKVINFKTFTGSVKQLWYESWLGKFFLTVIAGLLIAGIVYLFGWN